MIYIGFVVTQNFHKPNKSLILLGVGITVTRKARLGTIKTHLEHWLKFIGKDTKIKEMERTDCENYFHNRTKNKKKLPVSRTTVLNEQSSINAMMSWLHKRGESYIEAFEFKKLGKIDTGDERTRTIFTMPLVTTSQKFLYAIITAESVRFNAERRIIEARYGTVIGLR